MLKITYPFPVKQVGPNAVMLVETRDGRQLLDINYNSCFEGKLNDELCDKIYYAALTEVIRGTATIEQDQGEVQAVGKK